MKRQMLHRLPVLTEKCSMWLEVNMSVMNIRMKNERAPRMRDTEATDTVHFISRSHSLLSPNPLVMDERLTIEKTVKPAQ